MSVNNIEGARAKNLRIDGLRYGMASSTPANNAVIAPAAPTMQVLNPAGAINMRLPTSSPDVRGLSFILVNASANVITLQTDSGGAFTPALTVAANGTTRVTCTGSTTQASGWIAA